MNDEYTNTEDTNTEGTNAEDTNAEDTNAEDTNTEDTNTEDTNAEDTNTEDTNTEDTNTEDTNTEDTNTEDTNTEDTDAEDTDAEDTDAEDTDAGHANVPKAGETKPAPTRRAPIAMGGRDLMIKVIKENAVKIAEVGNSPLLTARQILDVLKSERLLPPLVVAEIKSANGVGDALGFKHLDLPYQLRGAKRAYLIEAANWTAEQKKEFHEKSSDEQQSFVLQQFGKFLTHQES